MKVRFLVMLITLLICSMLYSIPKLQIITEEYPPFNYSENSELKGIFIEILDYMLKDAGSSQTVKDVQVLPWARGYNMALNEANTVLFATSFTPERKDLFKWVGPVMQSNNVLFGKKSKNIKVNDVKDLQNVKIGVIHRDVAEELILNQGVNKNLLDPIADPLVNIRKLAMDRVDLIAYGEITANWMLKNIGENPGDYETVKVLRETPLYFAVSKSTSDEIVNALQKSLDKLKTQDKALYDEIMKKYGN